ncbi:C-type lectin-like domain-containing protein [Chryseobacterium taklimakanense]|uniref:Uncharacterized protein n=1 Tax=Chryseobacterium taklimakanense TaxID=536441 RepID=A0A3G8WUX2_9FLAO|nr:hypothetical protein [Chryseobacterium taklimakanense]AZI20181.1 hypothetical protein EIH08_05115 [Chryseobacterium taklimakanense]
MKINYKLEVHYFGNDENNNKIDRYDYFVYNSENSLENRRKVFDDYKKFSEVFKDAESFGKLNFNWSQIFEKNLKEYHIPSMNNYYSENEFEKNDDGIVLFGKLLESFEERMEELSDELKLYNDLSIPCETEFITDIENNRYRVIKGSLIKESDWEKIKNRC